MTSPNPHSHRRRVRIGLLAVIVSLAWVGWTVGHRSLGKRSAGMRSLGNRWEEQESIAGEGLSRIPLANPRRSTRWLVHGSSMAPTLWGESVLATCVLCKLDWVVDAAAKELSPGRLLCSHCGTTMELGGEVASKEGRDFSSVVEVQRRDASGNLRRGGLVAARHEGSPDLFVKRIVGVPGDIIDVDADGMHLLLNGGRAEDRLIEQNGLASLPRFIVDSDDARAVSRWSADLGDSAWTRTGARHWLAAGGSETSWLIYRHQSVYDQNRTNDVLDDYPSNVAVTRTLQPVDRFQLSGSCECAGTAKIEVAFWSQQRTVISSLVVQNKRIFETSYFQAAQNARLPARESAATGAPVSAQQPVAIRVSGESVVLSSLLIQRWNEYRLRPSDDRDRYPIRIGDGQLFLLGDNVPVSVDSRDYGLVAIANVLGTVSIIAD